MAHEKKMLIIHGYSDGTSSFQSLKSFFVKKAGYKPENVHLLKYDSMNDDANFKDFADKLDSEYSRIFGKERIDVTIHSTGALVVRIWLAVRRRRQKELGQPVDCPVKRILMLAPANFGSDLAKMGQSYLGRIRATFFNDNSDPKDFLESGRVVLQGLEPASPFQWDLSKVDLYQEDYFSDIAEADKKCYPFVFAAGNSYKGIGTKLVKQRKKPGTDGTVRICGTSLNTRKCTITFLGPLQPDGAAEGKLSWHNETKHSHIPFAVFNGFNHGSIIDTGFADDEENQNDRQQAYMEELGPGSFLIKALQVESNGDYKTLANEFKSLTDENYNQMADEYKDKYQQVFFKVRDDVDLPVNDYFLDFRVWNFDGTENEVLTEEFDEKLEEKITAHSEDRSCRVMFLNINTVRSLEAQIKAANCKLTMDIQATSANIDIKYRPGRWLVYDGVEDEGLSFMHPNTTTLIDIIVNRLESDKILSVKENV